MGHLLAQNVSWSYRKNKLINQVDLQACDGQLVGLLGPNGSGKTTLLRLLAGLQRPNNGTILLDGKDLHRQSQRTLAQRRAIVSQDISTHTDITVRQVVELGRIPFRGYTTTLSDKDHQIIDSAMQQLDIATLHDRYWHTLSGGEKQRAHIARALAQQPREILLDEPTNHLDIRHQLELLRLLQRLQLTCIITMHDLNLAARYCDHIVVLSSGSVVAAGTPAQVLSRDLIRQVYEVDAHIDFHTATGVPHITYLDASPSSHNL